MEIRASDLLIKLFEPDDQSESAIIKLQHRPSQVEVINGETVSQRENLRRSVHELIDKMNPKPDKIMQPRFVLFDQVKVHMPDTIHDGEVARQTWDFTSSQWKYFVDCHHSHVNAWYFSADLDLNDPVLFEDD